MGKQIVEVIVATLEDAIEAELGGADRLEVVRRVELGGLTPEPELVQRIKSEVSLPLRVMIRESTGFATSSNVETEKLCSLTKTFSDLGVDGIVFGFLKNDEADWELIKTILASAPEIKATFHHAFEDVGDKLSLIKQLKKFSQIDRILAHGGKGTWTKKISRLAQYQEAAFPDIVVIAGGGLDASVMKMIESSTSITEFHFGTAARVDGKVSRECVAGIVSFLT